MLNADSAAAYQPALPPQQPDASLNDSPRSDNGRTSLNSSFDGLSEQMSDHKQHILLDALSATALSVFLISQGRASGQPVFAECHVDPFIECLSFLLYI